MNLTKDILHFDADELTSEQCQALRHRCGKSLLTPNVRDEKLVHGTGGLVRSVCPTELLDGFVCTPRQLQGDVDASFLIAYTLVGLEAEKKDRKKISETDMLCMVQQKEWI